MTTFYLIRHAQTAWVGKALAGRTPSVLLSAGGEQQAEELAEQLAAEDMDQIFSSPLERARQTAEPLSRALRLKIQISEKLNEIDFGDWTGRTLAELEPLQEWKQWNLFRSSLRIPNGELMLDVQGRIVGEIQKLHREFSGQKIALVSHQDPIKAAITHYLGMPLDLVGRLEIAPASVSLVQISEWGSVVTALNACRFSSSSQTRSGDSLKAPISKSKPSAAAIGSAH
jgi:broad specificity phosphatase PhoE